MSERLGRGRCVAAQAPANWFEQFGRVALDRFGSINLAGADADQLAGFTR